MKGPTLKKKSWLLLDFLKIFKKNLIKKFLKIILIL